MEAQDDKEMTWKKSVFSMKEVSLISPTTSIVDDLQSLAKPLEKLDKKSASQSVNFRLINTFDNVSDESETLDVEREQQKYEQLLVKYEGDIRQHISVEHQLQIYIDSLKQRIEELEAEQEQAAAVNQEARNEVMDLWAGKVEQNERVEGLQEQVEDLTLKVAARNKVVESLESINESLKEQVDILKTEQGSLTQDLLH